MGKHEVHNKFKAQIWYTSILLIVLLMCEISLIISIPIGFGYRLVLVLLNSLLIILTLSGNIYYIIYMHLISHSFVLIHVSNTML